MKRLLWLVVTVALALPTLSGCDMSDEVKVVTSVSFATLAHHTPTGSSATEPFFLNLNPTGKVGRNWQALRRRLEKDQGATRFLLGQEGLDNLLSQFKVELLNLESVIDGPAVSAYWGGVTYVILQVPDEAAAREAMIANLGNASAWEQVEFESRTLYHGQFREGNGRATYLAWTTADGLLFLTHLYLDSGGYSQKVVQKLQDLLQVTEEESVAALPGWQKLQDRLPEDVMGVGFVPFGQQNELPTSEAESLFDALSRSLEGVTLALVPEADGLRVEIDGAFRPEASSVPELQYLFDMPAIDDGVWGGLPADTAIALAGHDAAALLPWLQEFVGLQLEPYQQAAEPLGLDIETDLLAEGGPLESALAIGFLPPLANQPIIEGLTALQIVVALPDASLAQAEALQRAMEGRGAVFGLQELDGVEVQAQVGTAASGYAIAYAHHDGVLYLGTSPQVVGQGIAAAGGDGGLDEVTSFRQVRAALPDEPTLAGYVSGQGLIDLLQANLPEDQYSDPNGIASQMAGLEAIGLGLWLEPERLYGVFYLWLGE